MNKYLQLAFGVPFLLALTACQQESTPASTNGSAPTTQTTVPAVALATKSPLLSISPATMPICGPAEEATVKWDVHTTHSDVSTVEIWVGTSSSDQKLFAEGGASGESKTGPWTRPGTHFTLKSKADGKTLGEAVVGGPNCP